MKRKRPVVVLVMGILNIVFGSLGLLCGICGGLGLIFLFVGVNTILKDLPPADQAQMKSLLTSVDQFKGLMIGQFVLSIIMSLVLVAAGIGLLGMRTWARWASISYGMIAIMMAIFGLVLNLAFVNPAMEKWQQEMLDRQAKLQGGAPPPPVFGMNNTVSSVIGTIFSMAYAIVLLVVMLLPSVAAAFSDRGPRDGFPEPDWQHDDGRRHYLGESSTDFTE